MDFHEAHLRTFIEQGFMIVPDFLDDDELELVRTTCDREVERVVQEMRDSGVSQQGISVLDRKYFISGARGRHPELDRVIFSKKTEALCRATIGDTAYLHSEQFVAKMGDKETSFAWHQDSGYSVHDGGAAPHEPCLTCWLALDDMSQANGTISVLPFTRYAPSREILEHYWSDDVHAMVGYSGDDLGDVVEVPAGTLVAFSSRLLHRSSANTTTGVRRSYFVGFTPTLFLYQDESRGVYSPEATPVIEHGQVRWR